MKKRFIYANIVLLTCAVIFICFIIVTDTIEKEMKEDRLEDHKRRSVLLSEWYVSHYTDEVLYYPEELSKVSEKVEKKMKQDIKKQEEYVNFPLQEYVEEIKATGTQAVDSAPDDGLPLETSERYTSEYGVAGGTDVDEEELKALMESLEEVEEDIVQDERIVEVEGQDVIPAEDLEFTDGQDVVAYQDEYWLIAREVVPYTMREKKLMPEYKFTLEAVEAEDSLVGVLMVSLDGKKVLAFQYKVEGEELAHVEITEGVRE